MREFDIIGIKRSTRIFVLDEPGQGGAHHLYEVCENIPADDFHEGRPFARIKFQEGTIKEHGVNGCHHEDLIAIVINRLRSFQAGPLACRENALALTKLEECLHWLNHRTNDRIKRRVEGTNVL